MRNRRKLACEYFAKGAWEQYKLPYTVIHPFNCIGIGEVRAKGDKEVMSGNVKLAMSHVVPDLVQKVIKGQDPLHILGEGNQVRHYTYGGDLARGIRICVENEKALNEGFNLSTAVSTNVLELAETIWKKIKGDTPFRYVSDKPYLYDVQKRIPLVEKAENILDFKADTSLWDALDEIIPWIREQIELETVDKDAVLVAMGDLSDDMTALDRMFDMLNRGYDLVCGSRYMKGGRQIGDPPLKTFMSRMAGISLHLITGIPTHDISNSFKLYSHKMLEKITVESTGGFEIGMEIVVKAYIMGYKNR